MGHEPFRILSSLIFTGFVWFFFWTTLENGVVVNRRRWAGGLREVPLLGTGKHKVK